MNIEKLKNIKEKYDILGEKTADPAVIADNKEWTKLVKERAQIEPVALTFEKYLKANADIEQAKQLLGDDELKELAEMEIEQKKEEMKILKEEIEELEENEME